MPYLCNTIFMLYRIYAVPYLCCTVFMLYCMGPGLLDWVKRVADWGAASTVGPPSSKGIHGGDMIQTLHPCPCPCLPACLGIPWIHQAWPASDPLDPLEAWPSSGLARIRPGPHQHQAWPASGLRRAGWYPGCCQV